MTINRQLTILTAFLVILAAATAGAQSSPGNSYSTIITWSSSGYSPSDFPGKVLATNGSSISLSLIVLNNGKVVDLSNDPVLWYLDQNFLDGGVGQQQASSKVTQTAGGSHFVSVQVQMPDGTTISGSENIPITSYKAVIDAPYPNGLIPANSTINLSLIPYFFNVSSFNDFSFSWTINGSQQASGGSDNTLSLNVGNQPSGQSVSIGASVGNINNPYELASPQTTLYVK